METKSLTTDQMYRVLRGLPGEMNLMGPNNKVYTLIVENPNAPKNRCQETYGLTIGIKGPNNSDNTQDEKKLLSNNELSILRSGKPLSIVLLNLEIILNSNPGGHLIEL